MKSFFSALVDGKKFFDQYFPRFFLEIVETGAKKSVFSSNWAILDENLATSDFQKNLKSMNKIGTA